MADIEKRLKYYTGQFLQQQDFTDEQEYHLDRLRRHNRLLHTPGIASGLAVTANPGSTSAAVAPGTALDSEGRQIVLKDPFNVAFESSHNGQWVLVVISYAEEEADDATVGDVGKTRWLERPEVGVILETGAPAEGLQIRLARLRIAANGTIAEHDASIRTPVGARVRPDETFERLRLSRQGVSPSQWPVLSSGAVQQADLAGSLNVNGNILVTGTVDGRDVSADGTLLDTLAASKIEGVSNPGGNIDLVGQNGITIAGNDATNLITFTGGSPISIDGVSNAGGDIDFVGQNGISITPDNTGKLIAFSTSPADIGALPANEYLRRVVTYGSFSSSETLKVIPCGFLPKYVTVAFSLWGVFAGYYHTVYPTAFVSVHGTNSWTSRGSYHYAARFNGAPYWESSGYSGYSSLAWVSFYDYVSSPYRHAQAIVTVDSVDSSELVLRIERSSSTATAVAVYVHFQIAILG